MPARSVKPSTPTADEVPVNHAMLMGVRSEVLHRIDQGREEARLDNQKLDGKIDAARAELKADIQKLDGKIDAVRVELKADIQKLDGKIDAVRVELKADVQKLDGKIDAVRAELKAEIREVKAELRSDIQEVKADIGDVKTVVLSMQAAIHAMNAKMDRMLVQNEDQEARNKIVLDGHASVTSRIDQVEQRQTQVEETVRYLATPRPAG